MTLFTFNDALDELDDNFAFEIANGVRAPDRYLFSDVLPVRNRTTYKVENGSLTVRPTMAGVTGMDAPYAPSGHMDFTTFLERTAKITNEVSFPEKALRELQRTVRTLDVNSAQAKEQVVESVMNFTAKVLVQAHIDTAEYLRGQALQYGKIDWSFGNIDLTVDYGIPSSHKLNTKTGTDAYGGSTSKWWDDHLKAQERLGYNYDGPYMHVQTFHDIVENPENDIQIVQQNENVFNLARLKRDENGNRTEMQSNDTRERAEVTVYTEEGEMIDPSDPDTTIRVPFMEPGRVFWVGQGKTDSFRVGTGATDAAELEYDLGYTHMGPTVEGNGQPGRWANTYVPEGQEWQLIGQGVQNMLPVIENPERLVLSSTELQ